MTALANDPQGNDTCMACVIRGECQQVRRPERVWNGKCAYIGMNAHMGGWMSHLDDEGRDRGAPVEVYWGDCPRNPGGQHAGPRVDGVPVCQACGMSQFVPPPREQMELDFMPARRRYH